MTTSQLDVPLTPAPAVRHLARLGPDTRYVLSGFPMGLAAVVVCLTGLTLGLGLAVIWAGVPLLAATLLMARGFADAERERSAEVLGGSTPHPRFRTGFAGALIDSQSWRDLAHALFRFVPSTIGFCVVVTWWAGLLAGLTWGLWGWALPEQPALFAVLGVSYPSAVVIHLIGGVLFAITLPPVVRAVAVLEARFARRLLTPRRPPAHPRTTR